MTRFLERAFFPLIYLVVGLSFLPGAKIHAQTEADLFKKVFREGSPEQDRHLSVPLIADEKYLGDIMVILSDDPSDLQVEAPPFFEKMQPLVDPKVMGKIKPEFDGSGTIKIKTVQDSALEALFDKNTVELHIGIPPELRRTTAASLAGSSSVIRGELVQPSPLSAYCNIYAEESCLYQADAGRIAGRQPLGLRFEGALNVFGLVLESSVSFTEDADYPWQLEETRLVLDDVAHGFRYSLGQIVYPVTGFQRVVPLVGFSMAKNFALQLYRLSRPQGETEFFLKNPSKVDMVVDGKLIKTLQLPAGPHSLKGFSFCNGTNDLLLRIKDNFGREEELRFPFFFDSELLRFGEWQFSGAVGFPAGMERGLPSVEPQASHCFHAEPICLEQYCNGWCKYPGQQLRKSIKGVHSLSLYSNYTITENSPTDWTLLLGYTFKPPFTQHSFRTEKTMPTGKVSYRWQYSPKRGGDGIDSSVEIYGGPDCHGFSGKLDYANHFLESSFCHEMTPRLDQYSISHHESSLSLASALLFSGGRFGLSRPVRDSFVMVVPHPNLKKYTIGVNPVGDRYSARTRFMFPAVLPNLSSYNAGSFITMTGANLVIFTRFAAGRGHRNLPFSCDRRLRYDRCPQYTLGL